MMQGVLGGAPVASPSPTSLADRHGDSILGIVLVRVGYMAPLQILEVVVDTRVPSLRSPGQHDEIDQGHKPGSDQCHEEKIPEWNSPHQHGDKRDRQPYDGRSHVTVLHNQQERHTTKTCNNAQPTHRVPENPVHPGQRLKSETHHDDPCRYDQLGGLKAQAHHRELVHFRSLGHEDQQHHDSHQIHRDAQPHQPTVIDQRDCEIHEAPDNDP